jgi:hypothetical protein
MILRTLLALVLLLGAALVAAQPAGDEPAPADTTEQPAAGTGTDPAGGGEAASGPQRAPSDYRPSEQISEDLPVSFPVDI